jgi:hypothetical protein
VRGLTDDDDEPDDDAGGDNEANNDEEADDHSDELFDDGGATWNLEHRPPDLNEDEPIQLTIAQSKLDQLAQWGGLVVQLRESALAQGTPVTPLIGDSGARGTRPICCSSHAVVSVA